jgi:hypothetical protein
MGLPGTLFISGLLVKTHVHQQFFNKKFRTFTYSPVTGMIWGCQKCPDFGV